MAAPYVRFPKYPGKKVNETSKERWNRLWNKNETLRNAYSSYKHFMYHINFKIGDTCLMSHLKKFKA